MFSLLVRRTFKEFVVVQPKRRSLAMFVLGGVAGWIAHEVRNDPYTRALLEDVRGHQSGGEWLQRLALTLLRLSRRECSVTVPSRLGPVTLWVPGTGALANSAILVRFEEGDQFSDELARTFHDITCGRYVLRRLSADDGTKYKARVVDCVISAVTAFPEEALVSVVPPDLTRMQQALCQAIRQVAKLR